MGILPSQISNQLNAQAIIKTEETGGHLPQRAKKCWPWFNVGGLCSFWISDSRCLFSWWFRVGLAQRSCCDQQELLFQRLFEQWLLFYYWQLWHSKPTWSLWMRSFTSRPQWKEIKLIFKQAIYGGLKEFLRDLRKNGDKINNPPASLAVTDIVDKTYSWQIAPQKCLMDK